MKNKTKLVFYYLLEFILTVFVFITFILVFFKFTILNSNYLINKLEKNNYYHELSDIIRNDLEDYLMPSGLPNDVIDNIYTEDLLKHEVNNFIKNLYQGKKTDVNISEVQENLNNNIKNYLEKNNIIVRDENSLKTFTDEVMKIYVERIKITSRLELFGDTIFKVIKNLNKVLVSLIIIDSILCFIMIIIFRKKVLTIPLITSMILLLIVNYVLFEHIDIKHILFWNDSISHVMQSIFFDLSSKLKIISIIILVITFVLLLFTSAIKNKIEAYHG